MKSAAIVGELREWRRQIISEDGNFVVWGKIYGDALRRFPDGFFIHTTSVVKICEDTITTKAGNVYRLVGKPFAPDVNPWS